MAASRRRDGKRRAGKIHPLARLENRFHSWREQRARARGLTPTVVAFPSYGSPRWTRVLARVLILPKQSRRSAQRNQGVRGWRSFMGIPIPYAHVTVTVGETTVELVTDRGGVIDAVIEAQLQPGWQTYSIRTENGEDVTGEVFIVGDDVRFGVVSDVDDTVLVTALPRKLVAAWNSFVINEHARLPVPGMAVLLDRILAPHPGAPMIYLSTGAWSISPMLKRFQQRHLFPAGAMLLTDWGPTHDRWFRSGQEHKRTNLNRLAEEFPDVQWLLIGDDGQHDDEIYTAFASSHPQQVAAVAIRRLSTAQAVLAGGRTRTRVDDHDASEVPWVSGDDGAGLAAELEKVGVFGPRA